MLILGYTFLRETTCGSFDLGRQSEITVATRGQTEVDFGAEVKRIRMDREDPQSVAEAARADEWDIVYDNICYSRMKPRRRVKHLPDGRKDMC